MVLFIHSSIKSSVEQITYLNNSIRIILRKLSNPNLKNLLLWTFRRNEIDVIHLYDYLSSMMQVATNGNMLNFGYWDKETTDPVTAQTNLCEMVGNMSELDSAKNLLDVGSGFSEPAEIWKKKYHKLDITCLNINQNQLRFAKHLFNKKETSTEFVNSTATYIPFKESSFDRIIALESAQHFKPFNKFVSESSHVLKKDGVLCIAIPILAETMGLEVFKMGILKFTWYSEHYNFEILKKSLVSNGFEIIHNIHIGNMVYSPLANYYMQNRENIKSKIVQKYPDYVEKILFKSIQKMREISEKKIIDYVLIKAVKTIRT